MTRTWLVFALLAIALSVSGWILIHPDAEPNPEFEAATGTRPTAGPPAEAAPGNAPSTTPLPEAPPAPTLPVPVRRETGRLAGRVEDRGGIPLRGARVTVVLDAARSGATVKMEQRTPTLDDAAAFTMEVPAAGVFTLYAEADGFAPARVDGAKTGDVIALRLDPPSSLGGIVRESESGRAIAGAKISFTSGTLFRPRETTSAEDGTFALLDLPAGDARVRAESDDHADRDDLATSLRVAEHADLEIVLAAGRSIEGRVLAAEDGAPIASAVVQARRRRTRSDADGRFVLRGLPEGVTTVAATGTHHERTEVNVTLAGTRTRAEIELRLKAGATVEGEVVDLAGTPIASARLRVFVRNRDMNDSWFSVDSSEAVETTSGEDGRFVLTGVPVLAWAVYGVRAARAGGAEGFCPPFELKTAQDRPTVRIVVAGTVAVAGKVLDAERKPVAGATIETMNLTSPPHPERRYSAAISDANGEFVVPALGEGRFRFRATAEGRPAATSANVDVDPRRGPPPPIEVRFVPSSGVRGLVVDAASGEPVSGAKVRLHPVRGEPLHAVTDPDGRFSAEGVPLGAVTFVVAASGYRTFRNQIDARAVANEQRFALVRQGALRGQVVDRSTGQPIRNFRVRATRRAPPSPRERFSDERGFEDDAGRFTFEVPDGSYELRVAARGYLPITIDEVTIDAARAGPDSRCELAAATWLEGRVLDGDGRPVAGAGIHLRRSDAVDRGYAPRGESEADGYFYIGELEAGSFDLAVTHEAYPVVLREGITVDGTARSAIEVLLRAETTLVLAFGIPKTYVPAPKNLPGDGSLSLALDSEGRLVMERPRDRAAVRVRSETGAALVLERRSAPGFEEREEPIPETSLGRFDGRREVVVKRLPPGSYVLTASFPGRKAITHRFELLPFREERLHLEFRTPKEIADEASGEIPAGTRGR